MNRQKAIIAILAGGFLMTVLEVRDLHREILSEKWQGWIPVIYGVVAIAIMFAYLAGAKIRALLLGIFSIGIVVGMAGAYFHIREDPASVTRLFTSVVSASARNGDDEREGAEREAKPPPLAPLAIAGLSAIGIVCLSSKFRDG